MSRLQILEDMELACNPKPAVQQPLLIELFQKFFNTQQYYNLKSEEEDAVHKQLGATLRKLAKYNIQELNEVLAEFNENQLEFRLLQGAIGLRCDREGEGYKD